MVSQGISQSVASDISSASLCSPTGIMVVKYGGALADSIILPKRMVGSHLSLRSESATALRQYMEYAWLSFEVRA